MVSNASEDLPEPERPVITVKRSRGISTLMFFRLCWRAPLTLMRSMAIAKTRHSNGQILTSQVWSAVLWPKRRQVGALHGGSRWLEVEAQAEFHSARRLCRSSLAEEGRGLDAGK